MFKINDNYLKLPGSYLFSTIGKKVAAYKEANPDKEVISLGIGDVTQPLAPAVIDALHSAVDEMSKAETFHGYAPDLGYEFLRRAIIDNDYKSRGVDIALDEVFVSDGAKSDSGNIVDIFAQDNIIAGTDPVYPVYVDSNAMAGKTGEYLKDKECCEAYISESDVPHSIYECDGAKTCAIEMRSFSKNAGFTGTRLGFTIVPKDLKSGETSLNSLWARRHGTKFNGAPYIIQRAGEAVYSEAGKAQTKEQIAYYMNNAKTIRKGLTDMGYTVFGGVNAPYIWLQTPDKMKSWDFFDMLLEKANVVGTPGSGFGPSGEGYFRLTAFGSAENTKKALERIRAI